MTDFPVAEPPSSGSPAAGPTDGRPAIGGDPGGPGIGTAALGGAGIGASGSAMAADWPKKAADAVDLVVDTIHDKAIRPVVLAARAIVFGLLVAVLALVVLVLLAVGLVRLLDVYAFGGRVWISYAVLGGIFSVAGLFAWTRRTARSPATEGR